MYVFGDSFDLYTAISDMTASYWDAGGAQGSMGFQPGRFSGGRCLTNFPNNSMSKASGSNDAVHHFVLAFQQNTAVLSGTTLGFIIQLVDGSTNQCCIVFRSDGAILLTSGGSTGTVLATYTGAITAINQWFAFEIEVVINNTTGSFKVRTNGSSTDSFSATGLNTRNSANNYANKITIGDGPTGVSNHYVDDLLWRSDPSSVPWIGDVRCYTRMPVSDVSVQFAKTGSSSLALWGQTGIMNTLAANQCEYIQITPSKTGLLTSVSFNCTGSGGGGTGHVKLALFSLVGNAVGAVLATSNEVTNPGNGIVTATFPTPFRVLAGVTYWIGIIQDANVTYNVINSSSAGIPAVITLSTTPYASWPIPNPGGTIAAINVPGTFTLYLTPSNNADAVNEPQQDGLTTYVSDSVVGDRDFYSIAARNSPAPPATTVAVVTRGFMQRSDAGSRGAAVQVKSGATTVQSTPTQPASGSFSWLYRTDLTDPNTSAAWAPSAVDAVQVGPIIVS